jgi:shikimate kinase
MAPKAVLVGMPGSGKSTIGRRLAAALRLPLLDTDLQIVATTGRSIADIFAGDGEREFRRIEEEVVRSALSSHDGIVSLGGGAVTSPGVRQALAGHTVVYLDISAAEGIRRTAKSTTRPLLAGDDAAETYRRLMSLRGPLYREVSTIRVNTSRRNPGSVVRYLASRLDGPRGAAHRRRPSCRSTPPAAPVQHSATDSPEIGAHPAADGPDCPENPTPATPAALAARRAEVRQ